MNENLEMLEYLYEDIDMGKYSLKVLEKALEGKDNKIKGLIADKQEKYEPLLKRIKKLLKCYHGEKKKACFTAKTMSRMNIKKEVKNDNSDSHIADMLIKGFTIGTLEIHKRMDNHEERIESDVLDVAKDVLALQNEAIKELKAYL